MCCRYDFFLISQSVRQGTVTPTHYNVIWDTSGLKPDHMQRLTYKMTHLYYNWPVSNHCELLWIIVNYCLDPFVLWIRILWSNISLNNVQVLKPQITKAVRPRPNFTSKKLQMYWKFKFGLGRTVLVTQPGLLYRMSTSWEWPKSL